MNSHRFIIFILATLLFGAGCETRPATDSPVILSLWHNYGGQLKDTMDEMIDEFNTTIGTEEGIVINVTSISGSAAIHEKLAMAAGGQPGAPELPDLTTAYPKTAHLLAEKGLLADLERQFNASELAAYIPQFLQEGRLHDGKLFVFPIAKSTEVLFVNTTIFNRFAADTGARLDDLRTFEGINRTAALYYEWTDRQTPAIKNDGKMFYMPDSLFNYALIGCKQLGVDLIHDGAFNLNTAPFFRVWESYYKPAVLGHTAIYSGYATDLAKTGDIVCSTGSTAGISFFSPTVTYPDNTSEPAELAIMPYPVFEGGGKVAIQRGAGICVIKSSAEKEHAAGIFLKWFTSPENNLRFVSQTGYLPVTEAAFRDILSREVAALPHGKAQGLIAACKVMQEEYDFYITPLIDGIDQLQQRFESRLREITAASRDSYSELLNYKDAEEAYTLTEDSVFETFIREFSQ